MSAAEDQNAVEAILKSEEDAWVAGDAEAFSRHVAEDCVFTNIFGQTFVGRTGFEAQHAKIFASIYRNTVLKMAIDHIRCVTPDVIVVDTTLEVRAQDGSPLGPLRLDVLRTKLNQVFLRTTGGWMITSYHNVDIKPPPGT